MSRVLILPLLLLLTACASDNGGKGRATGWPTGLMLIALAVLASVALVVSAYLFMTRHRRYMARVWARGEFETYRGQP